jgi:hypothetical protein
VYRDPKSKVRDRGNQTSNACVALENGTDATEIFLAIYYTRDAASAKLYRYPLHLVIKDGAFADFTVKPGMINFSTWKALRGIGL